MTIRKWKIYLAGPVSNCNHEQQTIWREEIKRKLKKNEEYTCIDPFQRHADKWTPFVEICDIADADVVIANMWRESIGTVAGIIQARKAGKPVILIDPNHIKSKVLEFYVGRENIVNTIKDAVELLINKIGPKFHQSFMIVKKGSRESQKFNLAQMERSLTAACARAGINDVLAALVASELQTRVYNEAQISAKLDTGKIKAIIYLTKWFNPATLDS